MGCRERNDNSKQQIPRRVQSFQGTWAGRIKTTSPREVWGRRAILCSNTGALGGIQ